MLDIAVDMTAFDRYADELDRTARDHVPFALAKTVTQAGHAVRKALEAEMPRAFDRPTPFTMRAFAVKSASKRDPNPQAEIFAKDIQAEYLALQIFGGVRRPKAGGKAVLTPGAARLNRYGNLPRRYVARANQRRNQFVGTVRFRSGQTVSGVWQRPRRRKGKNIGRLQLMVLFEDQTTVRPRFDFAAVVARTATPEALLSLFRVNLARAARVAIR